jgi:hypothetical protein
VPAERKSFRNDYYAFSIRAVNPAAEINEYADEGVGGYPPEDVATDGLIYWTQRRVVVRTGKEMGPVEVDLEWAQESPGDIYNTAGLASACDLALPSGLVLLANGYGQEVDRFRYPAGSRIRVFVSVIGRDIEPSQGRLIGNDPNTGELFAVTTWPIHTPQPWWCNERYDATSVGTLSYEQKAMTTRDVPS